MIRPATELVASLSDKLDFCVIGTDHPEDFINEVTSTPKPDMDIRGVSILILFRRTRVRRNESEIRNNEKDEEFLRRILQDVTSLYLNYN